MALHGLVRNTFYWAFLCALTDKIIKSFANFDLVEVVECNARMFICDHDEKQ